MLRVGVDNCKWSSIILLLKAWVINKKLINWVI